MRKLYISIALLLIAGIVGFLWYGETDSATQSFGTTSDELVSATTTTTESDVIIDAEQPGTASAHATQSTEQPVPATPENEPATTACESVNIVVEPDSYEICITESVSVLDVMKIAAEKNGLVFVGREYPSLGLYIESIHGKKSEGGYYWFLYINGMSSTEGASTALARPGDVIEWRYKLGY